MRTTFFSQFTALKALAAALPVLSAAIAAASASAPPPAGPVVVGTGGPLSAGAQATLDQLGLTLHRPNGPGVMIGSLRGGAATGTILAMPGITALRTLTPQERLDPELAAGVPEWMLGGAEVAEAGAGPIVAYVTLTDPGAAQALGGDVQIVGSFDGGRCLVVSGALVDVQDLAALDGVLYVEAALPPLEARNDGNRARTGAGVVQDPPYDLDGSGVTALVFDVGGVLSTHQDFIGRVTLVDGAAPAIHPTHVAGTLGGSGAASGGQYRGMAPAVHILSARFQAGLVEPVFFTNPGDIEADYASAFTLAPGLAVANNSIGLNVTANNYACSLFGNYGATGSLIDGIVAGSLGSPLTVCWSAGNDRPGRCGSEYGTLSPPSAAKNPIVVGALNSDDDSMTTFSSWGPTDDGRLKPDIAAPGDERLGDEGVTSTTSTSATGYTTLFGTSMASPTMAGLAALLVEDFRTHNPTAGDPLPSTVKALVMHTAADVEQPGPDYKTGYGSVRIVAAVEAMRSGRFVEDELTHGERTGFDVTVAPGEPELRLTLAWDDPAALAGSPVQLVNDLDLIVTDPSGTRAYPWTLDPGSPSAPATRDREDHVNNAEQVLVESPAAGVWRVEVAAADLADGRQPVSLVSSHHLTPRGVRIRAFETVPGIVAPGEATAIDVEIITAGDAVTDARMFYRLGAGAPFASTPLTPVAGDTWRAMLPAASCGDAPEVYFSATGSVTGEVTNPIAAPAEAYGMIVGVIEEPFADDFELDLGWTVTGTPSDGPWQRGVPAGSGQRGDAPEDFDGSGSCFVTGLALNADLDGGATVLTSPTFDASGGAAPGAHATLSYARWFSNSSGSSPFEDTLVVEISNDGGMTWMNLETVGPAGDEVSGGWILKSWNVADALPPTNAMRLRFTASDTNLPSIVEAGVDAMRLTVFSCEDPPPPCFCDVDGAAGVDVFDLLAYLDDWFAGAAATDIDGTPGVDVFDLLVFLDCWFSGC